MRAKIWTAALVLSFAISASAQNPTPTQSKIDPAKEADIRRLIQISGAAKIGDQMMGQMMGPLRNVFSSIVKDDQRLEIMLQDMLRRFQKVMTGERLVEEIIPIYDRYLTHEDIQGLIAFYATSLGKKMLDMTPKIMADSMESGSKLGQKLMLQVIQDMSKDYPELKLALEPSPVAKPPQQN